MSTNFKHLTLSQQIKLADFIRSSVAADGSLGMSDSKFAEHAASKLGFRLTLSHINNARAALSVPPFLKAGGSGARLQIPELASRIKSLETQVAALQSTIRDLQVRSASVPPHPSMVAARSNGIGSGVAHN